MRFTPVRLPSSVAVATLLVVILLLASVAWAGDPIPEIDVVLEQIPGGLAKFDSPTGGFDEFLVDVGKPFAAALSPVRLPPGWAMERKGKTVRLSGPALPHGQPVRLELDAGTTPRPQKISYQVKLEGRTLLERKNEAVELVPPRKVIGSLQGIVTVPSQVAPGEPMQMRVTESAALPAGGTWSLSGTVVAEKEPADEDGPKEPVVVTFTPEGGAEIANPGFADEFPAAYERIVRFAAGFAASVPESSTTRLTITPDGSLDWDPPGAAPAAETAESLLIGDADSDVQRADDLIVWRELPWCRWWRPRPPQCRVKPQKPDKPTCPNGYPPDQCTHWTIAFALADGAVSFDLPEDLAPGGSVALQYVDLYGDIVLDVPTVPGIEVVEPTVNGAARITDATPRTSAGQTACVCGLFPGPDAWNGLLLDGEALGPPVSASSRMAWVQLPAGLAPGPHVVSGAPEPGFPADDRATILVVEIGGEVDSTKLQRLESTPMRLWLVGTSEPADLHVRNKTPSIISIEGGNDQIIRTSGGEPNQLQRTVRGLSPGAFDILFELAGEECPCASSETHYW
jgi:hypothetical protein